MRSQYANKGKGLELEAEISNKAYLERGIALIQKIPTPIKVVRNGKKIVSAFYAEKSTLDFRGTAYGVPISFDCKESAVEGLPLSHIQPHQIEYIKSAMIVGEVSFILCYVKPLNKRYVITDEIIIDYWERWQANKGRRGYNTIPVSEMIEVVSNEGILLDYLHTILEKCGR